jgi:hypothetical protein
MKTIFMLALLASGAAQADRGYCQASVRATINGSLVLLEGRQYIDFFANFGSSQTSTALIQLDSTRRPANLVRACLDFIPQTLTYNTCHRDFWNAPLGSTVTTIMMVWSVQEGSSLHSVTAKCTSRRGAYEILKIQKYIDLRALFR